MSKQLKDSQENPEEHSEVKVLLLKKYMEAYINILANSSRIRSIYIHDLFCGPGRYLNGKVGSPIIFLNEIKQTLTNGRLRNSGSTIFKCVFNDNEKEKTEKLGEEIQKLELGKYENIETEILNKNYRDILPEVISLYGKLFQSKAFVFIDPYGYKDIRVDDIRSLLSLGHTEVLLFLPTQFMFRFGKKGTPEVLKAFMSELGIDLSQDKSSVEFINEVKEGFRRCLGSKYFVDSFVIQRDKNQFFAMFFFSSHILGFEKMLEAKWKIDENEGKGWQPPAHDLFSTDNARGDTRRLEELLNQFLKPGSRSNYEIYEFTLRAGFLPKHAKEVLMTWQLEGRIACYLDSGSLARKNSFYLSYRPEKVVIIKRR